MKTFKEIYEKVQKGYGVSTDDFVEAYEEEYPDAKLERIKKEHDVYVVCLNTALKNFDPDRYIFHVNGLQIPAQDVRDYFLDLIEENFELEQEIVKLKKELNSHEKNV